MSYLSAAIAILVIFASPDASHAQSFGNSAPPAGMSVADCEQLARLPNSPISVATCKAMMGMAAGLDAAAADPSARRPGDDAMTCAQIFGELQTMAGVGISEANVAKSETLVRDGTAVATRQAGEMSAFIAESYVLGAAVGALSVVTPNFVGAAIAAAWQARVLGLAAKAQAEQAPINARMNQAMLAMTDDLMHSLQANPRFARLMQLAMHKDCEPPATGAR